FIGWEAMTGGAFSKTPGAVKGVGFAFATNFGDTFHHPKIVMTYTPFITQKYSGNGARECGDAPFNCPTGFTFPRFDLAGPYLAADNSQSPPTVVMAFQVAQSSGQGQIEFVFSTDGGATWSTPGLLASSSTGHQFY